MEEAELYYFLYHNISSNSVVATICIVYSLFFSLCLFLSLSYIPCHKYVYDVCICLCLLRERSSRAIYTEGLVIGILLSL